MYKYTTQKSLLEIRGIAERAYTRGNKTCHVNVLALLAMLDELKAAEQSVHPTNGGQCAICGQSEDGHYKQDHLYVPAIRG